MEKLINKVSKWFSSIFCCCEKPVDEPVVEEPVIEEPVDEHNEIPIEEPMETHKLIILLDNGHASSTPGKRSPKVEGEEQFYEYEFTRDIVRRIAEKLDKLGIKYEIIVPEVDEDIPLSKRAERANAFCLQYGKSNCIFISVHANAAGNGSQWMNARGWSCYTSVGETKSDKYAEIFMKKAADVLTPLGQKVRRYSSNKYSWEENFTVLVKTVCPALLTENLFYDNKADLAFLRTEEGREAIAQIHVNAILEIEEGL